MPHAKRIGRTDRRGIFQILCELFDKYPDWREKLRLEFVGRVPEWLTEMIQEFDLGEHVTLRGQVSLEESLRLQQSFDFFLGTSAKIEGQSDYSMGSKYYEALQFQKPILGVCGPSPLADLIQKSGLGVVLTPMMPEKVRMNCTRFCNVKKCPLTVFF